MNSRDKFIGDGSEVVFNPDPNAPVGYRPEEEENPKRPLTNLIGDPRSIATGRFKRPGSGSGKGEPHEAAQRGKIALSDDNRQRGVSAKIQADAGHNPPNWVEDEATWEKAKAAADKGDYDHGSEQYWAVVTHIYEQMGGTVGSTNNQRWQPLTSNCPMMDMDSHGMMGMPAPPGSLADTERKVHQAYHDAYPPRYDPETGALSEPLGQVVAVFPGYLICVKEGQLYRHEYQEKDGEITLKGKPIPVREELNYVEI